MKAIWFTNNNKWNPQISDECKVTQFLHFKSKSPFHQFPNKWEKFTFDADGSGSSAGLVRKWKYPYQSIHLENFITMTLYCPGIVFFNIQKMSQKYIGILISMKCFVPAHYWKMQFVHNIAACLKNRQVSNYQPLAFELKAFRLGTPVAFPQHVLLDFNKQIAQITQRQL